MREVIVIGPFQIIALVHCFHHWIEHIVISTDQFLDALLILHEAGQEWLSQAQQILAIQFKMQLSQIKLLSVNQFLHLLD
ncbi:hypothetical protein D3C81_1218290 [compost metagenome]